MALQKIAPANDILTNGLTNKDHLSRLGKFETWLDESGLDWFRPDLAAYRDYLLTEGGRDNAPLAASSVKAHLSTIRGQYKRLLRQRELFFAVLPSEIAALDFPQQKPYVDELIARLAAAVHPETARVKIITKGIAFGNAGKIRTVV